MTEEQVYRHYHPNAIKAREAIDFAVADGRRDLSIATYIVFCLDG